MKLIGACLMVCGVLSAQGPQKQSENAARMAAGSPPIYRVTVTARTTKAISYRHRSGATKIDFRGTELLPGARGEAKIESKQGRIEIAVEFDGLEAATKNGTEYLTYVLWAVTPEGRTSNLGEVLLNGTKSKLDVSTELQVFGLVVTAEPYFAVTQPSDLIVMENVVRADTVGKIEEIDAKYELLQRGQYQHLANPLALKADRKLPLELYEARNAVQIARAMGADRFAVETFRKAEKSLAESEAYQQRNAGRKPVAMTAREAVQTAEDSRAIAVRRQEEEALAVERQAAMDREARAENRRVAAQSETDRVTREAEAARVQALAQAESLKRESDARVAAGVADADRLRLENEAHATAAKIEADRLKAENDSRMAAAGAEADRLRADNDSRATAAKAEADRLRADSDSRIAAAGAEADRLRADNESRATAAKAEADRLKADNDSQMAAAGAEADRLKRENEAQRAATQAELDNAARQTAMLEAQKAELRVLLLKQFNAILQTRDTARGLIVNMSDVLFDTGKSSLRPLAREKLAKVAGIVSGHPGLRLDVEGYTDSVGGDAYNQQLSEQRGESVRGYLTQQGMAAGSVSSKGFGKTQPVASNDTAQGRQLNRRVELVISGEVIGTEIGKIVAAK
jgi:outer membrane protein OmpA-like peptidoglycan-associated protein